MDSAVHEILPQYDLRPDLPITPIGSGHINWTYRVSGPIEFVLQRINTNVFTQPELIESNLRLASEHLQTHHADYLFVAPLPTTLGTGMAYDASGRPWRLFRCLEQTTTIDEAETTEQAYNVAAEFGRLARYLEKVDVTRFHPTIPRFHDLPWRYEQFEEALRGVTEDRRQQATSEIEACQRYYPLVERFTRLINDRVLRLGVYHNDTKINNVLFDQSRCKTVAAIDLDTLMPGYFIFDLGDLVRTVVSPVSEEESDLSRVVVRREFYNALVEGYLSQMRDSLSPQEREQIPFAGPMMVYIMSLRFLADFLRGDTYYHTKYPGQNLVRARNQLQLLAQLTD
ncbi:MAG: phosphotransferase [Planctomycetota bacterium]|nr:phosphotransferase [Planctomycetota bacterium]